MINIKATFAGNILRAFTAVLIAISIITGILPVPAYSQLETIHDSIYKETITRGVERKKIVRFTQSGWLEINVVEADLTNNNLYFDIINNADNGKGTVNTTSTLDKLAEGNNSIAAVNGSFFILGSGSPIGTQISSKGLLTASSEVNRDKETMASLWIDSLNASAGFIKSDLGILLSDGRRLPVARYNKPYYGYNDISIIDRKMSLKSVGAYKACPDLLEIIVSDNIVTEVRKGLPAIDIPENGMVIIANGDGQKLLSDIKIGETVYMDNKFIPETNGLKLAISGGALLLLKGSIPVVFSHETGSKTARHPRSALGISPDGKKLFLVTVDGRQEKSIGLTQHEFAGLLLELGVSDAVNLDGGGSTSLIGRTLGSTTLSAFNSPSDGMLRRVANGFGIFTSAASLSPATLVVRPVNSNDGSSLPSIYGSITFSESNNSSVYKNSGNENTDNQNSVNQNYSERNPADSQKSSTVIMSRIFAGSSLELTASSLDINYNPIPIDKAKLNWNIIEYCPYITENDKDNVNPAWSSTATSGFNKELEKCNINNGIFRAETPGVYTVRAELASEKGIINNKPTGTAIIEVMENPVKIIPSLSDIILKTSESQTISFIGIDKRGYKAPLNLEKLIFAMHGTSATLEKNKIKAVKAGRSWLDISVGSVHVYVNIYVRPEKRVVLYDFETKKTASLQNQASSSKTASPSSPQVSITATATSTRVMTYTPSPTRSPAPTQTPISTLTQTPISTPTHNPAQTPTPTPTPTQTETAAQTQTSVNTPTHTLTPTLTSIVAPTLTSTTTLTQTSAPISTITPAPTPTSTAKTPILTPNPTTAPASTANRKTPINPSATVTPTPSLPVFVPYPADQVKGSFIFTNSTPAKSSAGKLAYTFTQSKQTRAAYVQFPDKGISIGNVTEKLLIDVYSNKKGTAFLRAILKDADGKSVTLEFCKSFNWLGWKQLDVKIESNVKLPAYLQRIYIVKTNPEPEKSFILLDNLTASSFYDDKSKNLRPEQLINDTFEVSKAIFTAYPSNVKGSFKLTNISKVSGMSSGMLSYDFPSSPVPVAAYMRYPGNGIPVEKDAKKLGMWIYNGTNTNTSITGSVSTNSIKAEYVDKNGKFILKEIVPKLDFTGWKYFEQSLDGIDSSCFLRRLYVLRTAKTKDKGYVLFDNLVFLNNEKEALLDAISIPAEDKHEYRKITGYLPRESIMASKDVVFPVFSHVDTTNKKVLELLSKYPLSAILPATGKNVKLPAGFEKKIITSKGGTGCIDFNNCRFIQLDTSKMGLRSTDKAQWGWFLDKLYSSDAENIFIFMKNSPEDFIDKQEGLLFENILTRYSKSRKTHIRVFFTTENAGAEAYIKENIYYNPLKTANSCLLVKVNPVNGLFKEIEAINPANTAKNKDEMNPANTSKTKDEAKPAETAKTKDETKPAETAKTKDEMNPTESFKSSEAINPSRSGTTTSCLSLDSSRLYNACSNTNIIEIDYSCCFGNSSYTDYPLN